MSTPALHLQTLFLLTATAASSENAGAGTKCAALFCLIRGATDCAWAVRADVPQDVANELDRLAREEPPVSDFRDAPVHAERSMALVEGRCDSGPAFAFPDELAPPHGTVLIDDTGALGRHFPELNAREVPYRTPIAAVVEEGRTVSVCFSSRRSDIAAECGVETAEEYRGRGLAARVTAAWALAVRASGRVPLYSTSWSNAASLAVARKLGLVPYAGRWSIT